MLVRGGKSHEAIKIDIGDEANVEKTGVGRRGRSLGSEVGAKWRDGRVPVSHSLSRMSRKKEGGDGFHYGFLKTQQGLPESGTSANDRNIRERKPAYLTRGRVVVPSFRRDSRSTKMMDDKVKQGTEDVISNSEGMAKA